ncbi:hypothetical protein [Clostridium tagluense]|uniref:Copper amine oxidase-like N-terminal domain-containing protein n=1 Tax=Clostridium tagluense TaxID=360422 RepID=A0A401UNV5_9CLOT|nr:hypothetical protein [Clostridium tagluense]GCD11197.1 hypothetical protein Ctaglu_28200 [Clostridium tagluense]
MKFTKKTIAILTLGVFISGNSMLASANTKSSLKNDTSLKIQAVAEKNSQSEKKAQIFFTSTEGIVSDVQASESKSRFTIKNNKSNNDKLILNVNDATEIISATDGKKLNLTDIKDGVKVKAYYGPAVTASIPPMSTANMIIVEQGQEESESCNYGIITDVSLMKENKEITALMNGEIDTNLIINEKTEIVDSKTGKVVSYKDIKKGTRVIAYYNITTMSMPPIATPKKVVILSNQKDKDLSATATGLISDINIVQGIKNEIMVLVKGEKSKDNIYVDINFIINSKTEIISEKSGNKLTMEAIKNDTNVKVYYDGVLSKSLPPIGVAKKIVISEPKNEMGIIGDIYNIYTSEDKKENRIEIKGERLGESGFDNIILNISEKTKIVDFKTGAKLEVNDIKKDSKVVAYYGGKLTRSLPPIGFAEKIVLLKQ